MQKINKYILIAVPLILLFIGVIVYLLGKKEPIGSSSNDFLGIQKRGVLKIVTNIDPIGYFVSSDSVSGFNNDILRALQQYTNLRFEISVENSLERCFKGLESGKYDVVARNIPINSDLRNEYSFTQPTVYNKLILIQRRSEFNEGIEPIRDHLQLARKAVYVPKDSPSIFRLRNLSHEIGDTIYIIEDSLYEASQLALMVAAGDIGFSICDHKTAQKLAAANPELDIKTDIGFTHLEAWAVRGDSPVLLDTLNTWLNRFKLTKEYNRAVSKYYK